jgi:hypothetical protein
MIRDSLLAALWIKSRLGLDPKPIKDGIFTTVGTFQCTYSKENALLISGPGLDYEISHDRITTLNSLIEFLIEHGDSIVISPREIRETRISKLADKHDVDSKFIKTVIADARQLMDQ